MPTAFRGSPINYAATESFNEQSCELQFVGVSGYEVETLLAEGADALEDKNLFIHPTLTVPIDMRVSQTCLEDQDLTEVARE